MLLLALALSIVALPDWIAGSWVQQDGDRWTEELWTAPRGGMMVGVGRSGRGDHVASWELVRIERGADGALAYWGAPNGRPPVAFPLVSSSATEMVFANPAHDYPQRIRYWREGDTLNAEVSLADGSRAHRWRYRRGWFSSRVRPAPSARSR